MWPLPGPARGRDVRRRRSRSASACGVGCGRIGGSRDGWPAGGKARRRLVRRVRESVYLWRKCGPPYCTHTNAAMRTAVITMASVMVLSSVPRTRVSRCHTWRDRVREGLVRAWSSTELQPGRTHAYSATARLRGCPCLANDSRRCWCTATRPADTGSAQEQARRSGPCRRQRDGCRADRRPRVRRAAAAECSGRDADEGERAEPGGARPAHHSHRRPTPVPRRDRWADVPSGQSLGRAREKLREFPES